MEHIRKTRILFSILLFAIVFVSCVTTETLIIEIPQPSGKELPENIQSLTLVNRTVDRNYENHHHDSLQNIFYKKQFNLDTVIYDLQAVDTTLKALGELLYESGRYDFVIPVDRFLDFEKNSFLSIEMPWEEVKAICETYNTNAVLSMDHYKTQVITSYDKETFYNPVQDGLVEAYLAKIKINYEVMFRIYDPVNEKILIREFIRDSLIWEDADRVTRTLFNRMTSVKNALNETGIAVALDFSEKIGTVWREENRKYFSTGNTDFKTAESLVTSGNWQQAISVWQTVAENTNSKSTKSKAEYNIAVGFEILGNINQAIKWALQSYETMYRPITYEYLEILQQRKIELKN